MRIIYFFSIGFENIGNITIGDYDHLSQGYLNERFYNINVFLEKEPMTNI